MATVHKGENDVIIIIIIIIIVIIIIIIKAVRGLCDGPILRAEESYVRFMCGTECDLGQ